MVDVDYIRPRSVDEALSLLSEHGDKAKIIAGGTDLLIRFRQQNSGPDHIIAIESLKKLNYIREDKEGLRIGAVTRLYDIELSTVIKDRYPSLHQAIKMLATPTLRRQATIGGNLCNASPAADCAPPLIVLGAIAKIKTTKGERTIPIEDFFKGPGKTSLGNNELLTEIFIPAQNEQSQSAFLKMTRTQGVDLTLFGVAVSLEMDGEVVKDVKIAFGAVAPTPIRVKSAEKLLLGNKLDPTLLEKTSQAALNEASPIDDVRSSAMYRRKLVKVLVKRAILQAAGQES